MRAHLAAIGYEEQLRAELRGAAGLRWLDPRLALVDDEAVATWAQQTWYDVQELPCTSIGAASKLLRERGAYWHHYPLAARGRGKLIVERLPRVNDTPLTFPPQRRIKPRGVFALLDRERMLVAAGCARPFAGGVAPFIEDRENPPSRAYLKLWEALTLLGEHPGPGQRVLELGAAPGAWTWTLAGLGCEVTSIDKAPLDARVEALPNVTHRIGSAFAVDPQEHSPDWLFSDVVCYPERLQKLLSRWFAGGGCRRCVVAVKFQGPTDFAAARLFGELPTGRLVHLSHNKHELCWIAHPRLRRDGPWPWLAPEE
jgi:23S rRNA (cytidine2498-2'-O)-methyltransferase